MIKTIATHYTIYINAILHYTIYINAILKTTNPFQIYMTVLNNFTYIFVPKSIFKEL